VKQVNADNWNALKRTKRKTRWMISKSFNCSEREIPEVLNRLYWEEQKSIKDIATATDVSHTTVASLMKRLNIPTRYSKRCLFKWTEEELVNQLCYMYIEKNMKPVEIAIRLNVSPSTIYKWFGKYNIRLRKKLLVEDERNTLLCEMYLEKEWDVSQIANELNVSAKTIYNWLRKLEIPLRSRRNGKYPGSKEDLLQTIYFLYWKKGLGLKQTAQELNVSILQVYRWMEQLNIPRRRSGRPTKQKSISL
jgi:transposase